EDASCSCEYRGRARAMSQTRLKQLYGVDLYVGLTTQRTPVTLGVRESRAFSELTGDNHPIHYDEEFATRTHHGRCLVHGLLLVGVGAFGATPLSSQIEDAMIAFTDSQFQFLKPVFTGDTVVSCFRVASVEHKPARNMTVLRFDMSLINGAGDTVMEGQHTYLVR